MDEDWEEWDPKRLPFINHMIAGSFAGLAEHVTVFPIDTLKTHVQCEVCGSTEPNQVWNCASRLVRHEGFFRLWRGVSAMFAACIPAHAAYFSIYEMSKKLLMSSDNGEHQPLRAGLCGASASISHDFFMTPFDVVKQRMQLGYYDNIYNCVKSIYKYEGFTSFYRSLPLTVVMNIPYSVIMVAVNESMRTILDPVTKNKSAGISMTTALFSGAVGGGVAAAITTPLDVIKTTLQTQGLRPCLKSTISTDDPLSIRIDKSGPLGQKYSSDVNIHLRYRNAWAAMKGVVEEEGFIGFTRGMLPRVIANAPAAGISWAVYEGVKNLLSDDM